MKYAQILHGKAHWVFESESPPQFAPNIQIVQITSAMDDVQEGWDYDAETQTFTPPEIPPQPTEESKASIEEMAEETLLETKYQTFLLEMMI